VNARRRKPCGDGPLPLVTGVRFAPMAGHPIYAVGSDGSVWSRAPRYHRGKPGWRQLNVYRRTTGAKYCVVSLRANEGKGKVFVRYVHRLVLEAFVGFCPGGMQCCHGDGNTANNHLSNLRWDTAKANAADKVRHKAMREAARKAA
jgi:hypothetical protein